MAPQVVIDATKSLLQYTGMDDPSILTSSALEPLQRWVVPLKHLVPSWQGPCTHKFGSWCHHFAKDVEDSANDAEDPRDGPEALVDDEESLNGLEKH